MRRTQGFTLVELLVVIAIIGILISLLLPAVPAAREAARRSQCSNNLKQAALALHNFENFRKTLPAGGTNSPTNTNAYGHSWWMEIMPYLEQRSLFDRFDFKGVGADGHVGWMDANTNNAALLDNVQFSVMRCPSSPLPAQVSFIFTERIMSANYVGVAGATDHSTAEDKPGGVPEGGAAPGRISAGGVLILRRGVKFADIRDGASNTIALAEQSDWCRDASGALLDCRSDCAHGFAMGPGEDGWERHFNLTIALHRLNDKSSTGVGVAGNCGPNRPMQSAHPGGVQVAMTDGSIHFLSESLPIQLVYDLSNRDDGHVAPDF